MTLLLNITNAQTHIKTTKPKIGTSERCNLCYRAHQMPYLAARYHTLVSQQSLCSEKTTSQCHLNISLLLVCIQKKKLTRQIIQTCFLLCLLTTLHDEFWTNTVNRNWTQNSQFKFQAPNRFHMTNIQLFTISLSEEILIGLASMGNVPNMSAMQ